MSNKITAKQKKKKKITSKQAGKQQIQNQEENKNKRIVVIEFRNPLSRREKKTNKQTHTPYRGEHDLDDLDERGAFTASPRATQQPAATRRKNINSALTHDTFPFCPRVDRRVEGVVKGGSGGSFLHILKNSKLYYN